MNRKNFFKKTLVFVIIALFFCVSIIPSINANNYGNEKKYIENINDINIKSLNSAINDDVACLTFYTFDKSGRKQNKVELPVDIAVIVKDLFEDLEYNIVYDPRGVETQELKNDFINLIDEHGLLSERQSKDEVLSLLNPSWLEYVNNSDSLKARNPFNNYLIKPFFNSHFGMSVFCSVSSVGSGAIMPLFMLPRPRAVAMWFSSAYYGSVTSVSNLLTARGFIAYGAQIGFLLGFMGIGLTYSIPGATFYGFIGYSTLASVAAELMEFFPPNNAPFIFNENPPDGAFNVPIELDKLSFRIDDADGDLMSYKVTTDPDIGHDSENLKPSGVYSVPISGLKKNSFYKWTVEVTDGKDSTKQQFSFYTPEDSFNPFDEGWQYRKKLTINHTQVAGALSNFTMLVNTVDADLSAKAKADGDDILFMDGPGVANKLYHEIESYKSSTGELIAWVNIMNLKAGEDTVFYMYYGNPENINTQIPKRAWGPYFTSVWHLKESQGQIHDSTERVSGGVISGAESVPGKIGSALEFLNKDIVYDISSTFDDVIKSEFTVSCWMYFYGGQTNMDYYIFDGRDDLWDEAGFIVYLRNMNLLMHMSQPDSYKSSNSIIPSNKWTYVSVVFDDDANEIRFYINNQLDSIHSTSAVYRNSDHEPAIGNNHWAPGDGAWRPINGIIDELRIAKTARTTQWILTEYNNQNDPLGFLSFGPEESSP